MNINDRVKRQLVKRGEIAVSGSLQLCTNISTCVSICLYHPETGLGGITHISRSRECDTTPSGRFIMDEGFYYADTAVNGLLSEFRNRHSFIREESIELFIAGGINNEGPIYETLEYLKTYRFKEIGNDINDNYHRFIRFYTDTGRLVISKNRPFTGNREEDIYHFS